MKRNIKPIFALAASLLMLVGCNSSNLTDKDIQRKTLDPLMVKQNCIEVENNEPKAINNVHTFGVTEDFLYDTQYLSLGLIVTCDNEDNLFFFSTYTNDRINETGFPKLTTAYQVESNSKVGYVLKVVSTSGISYYDGFGNFLLQTTDLTTTVSYGYVGTNYCIKFSSYLFGDSASYIVYTGSTVASASYLNPGLSFTSYPVENDSTPSLHFGSEYESIRKMDLKPYGCDGYYLTANGTLFTVFKNDGTYVCTFDFDSENAFGIVNGKLVFQSMTKASETSEDYSFFDDQSYYKYVLNTYTIDVKTGKRETVDFGYVLEDMKLLKDSNGNYSIAYVAAKKILPSKTLGNEREYIMNDKLEFVNDITGENIFSFYSLPNGYFYNNSTKYLYDKKMKPAKYLGDINPTCDPSNGVIWGSINGKQGALDFEGKVCIEFKFNTLYKHVVSETVFGVTEDGLSQYLLNTGTENIVYDYDVKATLGSSLLAYNSLTSSLLIASPAQEFVSTTVNCEGEPNFTVATLNYELADNPIYTVSYIDRTNDLVLYRCITK